eukprot:scaffold23856_cov106-Isochrysis_galbana.AAC.3
MAPEMKRLNKTAPAKRQRSDGDASFTAVFATTVPVAAAHAVYRPLDAAPDAGHAMKFASKKHRSDGAQFFDAAAVASSA